MSDIPSLPQTFDPNGGLVAFGTDEKLFVRFFKKPELNGYKSREAGAPIYDDVDYVSIQQPGERDVTVRPVTNEHRQRFPRQWMAFQQGQEQRPEGTLVEILFPTNPGTVETLKFLKIFTVQQLAGASDTAIQNLGLGGSQWREMAKAFLDKAENGKDFQAVLSRLTALENENAALKSKVSSLTDELSAIDEEEQAPAPRRRGRPPRAA